MRVQPAAGAVEVRAAAGDAWPGLQGREGVGMITGRCLCGEARYRSPGPTLFAIVCHCRDCQRASGSAGVPVMGVSRGPFASEGPIKQVRTRGGSGHPAVRHICAQCGACCSGRPSRPPTWSRSMRAASTIPRFSSRARPSSSGNGHRGRGWPPISWSTSRCPRKRAEPADDRPGPECTPRCRKVDFDRGFGSSGPAGTPRDFGHL